jgi:hypothetical protein
MKTLLETFTAAHDAARATERPDPGSVTRTAASCDDGTNDLLVGDVLAPTSCRMGDRLPRCSW